MVKTHYLTTEKQRARQKDRYEASKAARGAEFLAEMARVKREWRAKGSTERDRTRHGRHRKSLKGQLLRRAKKRARIAGLAATIQSHEVYWPTHCPVLGIELDYKTKRGARQANASNLPSLDRWDNRLGYIPGNVFVISLRANSLKSNATREELLAVANYAWTKPALPTTDLFR